MPVHDLPEHPLHSGDDSGAGFDERQKYPIPKSTKDLVRIIDVAFSKFQLVFLIFKFTVKFLPIFNSPKFLSLDK